MSIDDEVTVIDIVLLENERDEALFELARANEKNETLLDQQESITASIARLANVVGVESRQGETIEALVERVCVAAIDHLENCHTWTWLS